MSITLKYSLNPVVLQSLDQEQALFDKLIPNLSYSLGEILVTLYNFRIQSELIQHRFLSPPHPWRPKPSSPLRWQRKEGSLRNPGCHLRIVPTY